MLWVQQVVCQIMSVLNIPCKVMKLPVLSGMALFIPTNTEFFDTIVPIFWNLNQEQKREKREKKFLTTCHFNKNIVGANNIKNPFLSHLSSIDLLQQFAKVPNSSQ